MKHIILSLMLIASIFTTSQAQGFIGVEVGQNNLTSEGGFEDSGYIYGAKFGAQQNNWRAYFGFTTFESDDSQVDQFELYVSADYIFADETQLIRPFIGGTVGFASTEYDFFEYDDSITYGVQAGALINLDPHFEIEAGVRYKFFYMDNTVPYGYEYLGVFDDKYDLYIGANYKF